MKITLQSNKLYEMFSFPLTFFISFDIISQKFRQFSAKNNNRNDWEGDIMSNKKKLGFGIAAFAVFYVLASIIISLCWFTNFGSYDCPCFGLLVVDAAVAEIEENEHYSEESGMIGGRHHGIYFTAYERDKYQVGDKVTTLCIMNPFSCYSDDIALRLDFKHLS